MSLGTRAANRLRDLYAHVCHRTRRLNAEREAYPRRLHQASYGTLIEQLEPRVLLSGTPIEIPGMHMVDPDMDNLQGQVVYLDFDGEEDLTYNGPVVIEDIDVPEFSVPASLTEQGATWASEQVLERLKEMFSGTGMEFTTTKPSPGTEVSTIYVGGNHGILASDSGAGTVVGLSETIDIGNQNRSDSAFVFSEELPSSQSAVVFVNQVSNTIAHEVGHLVGYEHMIQTPYYENALTAYQQTIDMNLYLRMDNNSSMSSPEVYESVTATASDAVTNRYNRFYVRINVKENGRWHGWEDFVVLEYNQAINAMECFVSSDFTTSQYIQEFQEEACDEGVYEYQFQVDNASSFRSPIMTGTCERTVTEDLESGVYYAQFRYEVPGYQSMTRWASLGSLYYEAPDNTSGSDVFPYEDAFFAALGFVDTGVVIAPDASVPNRYTLSGEVQLPSLLNNTVVSFSSGSYIEVADSGWRARGGLELHNLAIPGGWGIESASVVVDLGPNAPQQVVAGAATISIPPNGVEVSGSVEFVNGQLNAVHVGADGLNVLLTPSPPIHLQSIDGGLDHLVDAQPITLLAGAGFTLGPQISVDLPFYGDFSGSLMSLDLDMLVDRYHLEGDGTLSILNGLATAEGSAEVNWDEGYFMGSGSIDVLSGLLQGYTSIYADSSGNLSLYGTGGVYLPDAWWLPGGGMELASGSGMVEYTNNGRLDDDFVAAWGSLFGNQLGMKLTFDGERDILGAKEIESIAPLTASAQMMPFSTMSTFAVVQASISRQFSIDAAAPYVLVSVEWPAGETGALQLVAPDGTTYEEADFESLAFINNVPDMSDTTHKTLMIDSPAVGDWQVEVLGVTDADLSVLVGVPTPIVALGTILDNPVTDLVTIEYETQNVADEATVVLYYTQTGTSYDGIRLADVPVTQSGTGSYTWDVSAMPAGEYYIYAMIESDDSIPSFSEHSNPVSLNQAMLPFDGQQRAEFIDSSGDVVTVSLKGEGSGWVVLPQGIGVPGEASQIVVSGTASQSSLTISTKGREASTDVGQIKADGLIKSISGSGVNLTGGMLLNTGGAIPTAKECVSISLAGITDAAIDTNGMGIRSLSVTNWTDTDATPDALDALYVSSISVKGAKANAKKGIAGSPGDFQANITTTGTDAKGLSLGKLAVVGDFSGDHVLAGAAGSITVGRWATGSMDVSFAKSISIRGKKAAKDGTGGLAGDFGVDLSFTDMDAKGVSLGKFAAAGRATGEIRTAGSIGSVAIASVDGFDLLAGIDPAAGRFPTLAADFVNPDASIKSVKIAGIKGQAGTFFQDCNIAAATIGSVSLCNADFDAGHSSITAVDQGTGKEIKKVSYANKALGQKWSWPIKKGPFNGPADLINIL